MKKALDSAREAMARGEFPVGCILISGDNKIVGRGDRINSSGDQENELDHAEIRALRDWIKNGKKGSEPIIAYTTLEPCLMCLGALIINGVQEIVYAYEDVMGGAAGIDFEQPFSKCHHNQKKCIPGHLYKEFGQRIRGPVLRNESLELFRDFFSNPANTYLKNTLLETYTLSQKK